MANRKMLVSGTGKELLDLICDKLEVDRPMAIKIALAKGIAVEPGYSEKFDDGKPKWTMPESIIKDQEYVFFKHIIINEKGKVLNDEEVNELFLLYLEQGLRVIQDEINQKTTLEDIKIKILG